MPDGMEWRDAFLFVLRAGLSGEQRKLEECLSVHAQGRAQWGVGASRRGENLGRSGAMLAPTCNTRPSSSQSLGTDFCSEMWSREGCYGMRRSCLGRVRVTWCL